MGNIIQYFVDKCKHFFYIFFIEKSTCFGYFTIFSKNKTAGGKQLLLSENTEKLMKHNIVLCFQRHMETMEKEDTYPLIKMFPMRN